MQAQDYQEGVLVVEGYPAEFFSVEDLRRPSATPVKKTYHIGFESGEKVFFPAWIHDSYNLQISGIDEVSRLPFGLVKDSVRFISKDLRPIQLLINNRRNIHSGNGRVCPRNEQLLHNEVKIESTHFQKVHHIQRA